VVTALLIVDMVQSRRRPAAANGDPLRGGSASPTLFDQPLDLRHFTLTDETGQPFTSSTKLRGKVWVASFFFTRCTTVCPRVLAQTAALQQTLAEQFPTRRVVLVSITVDPVHDTPEVLRETAGLWQAGQDWRFLTGEKSAIWGLISAPDGFRDHVGDAAPGAAMSVSHSSRFVLIDRDHRIRGFYDALDEEKRAELRRDLKRLLE